MLSEEQEAYERLVEERFQILLDAMAGHPTIKTFRVVVREHPYLASEIIETLFSDWLYGQQHKKPDWYQDEDGQWILG